MVKKKGSKSNSKSDSVSVDTMSFANERDIARDFGLKVYRKFDQMIKSVILFGSSARGESVVTSDIDIVIIIDDVSIKWDEELIAWYREELGKLIQKNPYIKPLHINTVKLSTWWDDMLRGDPVIINVLRYGDAVVDFGGFFNPLRILLKEGKIKSTPESIYNLLQRAPRHMARARSALLASVDGLHWTMVDAAHALLISIGATPPSPEHIPESLISHFVKTKKMNKKYVRYYDEIREISRSIVHGKLTAVRGKDIDEWFEKADDFLGEMSRLVDEVIEKRED